MRNKPYMSLMGALLWCVFTRPDVAYYVSFLCQFMHDQSTDSDKTGLCIGLPAFDTQAGFDI
eukprot:1290644-Prymnesium_polylepis.1